jgi:hypothetical protein
MAISQHVPTTGQTLPPFIVNIRQAGWVQRFLILASSSVAALSCALSLLPEGLPFSAACHFSTGGVL